jgi:hypothetical protein
MLRHDFSMTQTICFFPLSGLYLNTKQVNTLREQHGIPEGDEWAPFSGFDASTEAKVKLALADSSLYSLSTQHEMAKKASEEKKSAIVRRDYSAFAEVHEIPGTTICEHATL